jgi:uncharacterized protein (TIGR02391 family)
VAKGAKIKPFNLTTIYIMNSGLLKPKDEFNEELRQRIAIGQSFIDRYNGRLTPMEFEAMEKEFRIWDLYNKTWLEQAFLGPDNSYCREYKEASVGRVDDLLAIANNVDTRDIKYRASIFKDKVEPKLENLQGLLARIDFIRQAPIPQPYTPKPPTAPLSHLHPAVQQAAGSLFDTNHYPHAIQAACTALEKAIQHKSGQSASVTGTALIGRAFPKDNPLLTLSADQGEREGYGFLYRGLLQAVRNHYAHNLTEISAPRALEWLSFISALFHKLDEAQLTPAP